MKEKKKFEKAIKELEEKNSILKKAMAIFSRDILISRSKRKYKATTNSKHSLKQEEDTSRAPVSIQESIDT